MNELLNHPVQLAIAAIFILGLAWVVLIILYPAGLGKLTRLSDLEAPNIPPPPSPEYQIMRKWLVDAEAFSRNGGATIEQYCLTELKNIIEKKCNTTNAMKSFVEKSTDISASFPAIRDI